MTEEWRKVSGFEKCYEVSSLGRLRNIRTGKILRSKELRGGYVVDILCDNNRRKTVRRHRLVAEAFIPNPDNKPEINHKNGNKADNAISNLEWATHRENTDHSWATGLTKLPTPTEKSVSQYFEGKWIATYRSLKYAEKLTGINIASILKCCTRERKSAGGYEWKYGGIEND